MGLVVSIGLVVRSPGLRLAARWAASLEGNEGRAQQGWQRAGGDRAPPLLSPQVGYFVFKFEQQHKLERLFKLEQPFTLPPLPLRPVSGRHHYLHSYGYCYVKYAPLPLAPVSR